MTPPKEPRAPRTDGRLGRIGKAIADEKTVDWKKEGEATPALQRQLHRLQQLQAMARANRIAGAAESTDRQARAAADLLFEWGPFRALEMVGEGSFGQVYRALDLRLHREVALKLRRIDADGAEASGADSGARRFLEEARALARVRHSNILVVHGADVHDGRAGFWTDFIRGRTLEAIVRESGPLTPQDAARVGVSLCHALAAVHAAGLIHGDVKAANVMREDGGRVLLMDFGAVNRVAGAGSALTGVGRVFLTPIVSAPEVLRGDAPQLSADIYSLGVLLHFLLSGRLPVVAPSWSELLQAHEARRGVPLQLDESVVPASLTAVLERALSPDAPSRYQSADEVERALLAALPSQLAADDTSQTLASLLQELGRVPEELCRQIAAGLVKALLASPTESGASSSSAAHPLRLHELVLRQDGRVQAPHAARGDARGELVAVGRALFELATGASASTEVGELELVAVEHLSPFFRALTLSLLEPGADRGLAGMEDLGVALRDGEKGSWWRERVRATRETMKPKAPRAHIARDTSIYGRAGAFDLLADGFERAGSGRGQVVLLQGEVGLGKTRLVDEFLAQLEQHGEPVNLLVGSYPPGDAVTEVGAFLNAYREHFGDLDLEATLFDYLREAPLLVPPLLALFRGERGSDEGGEANRDLVQRALVRLTQALGDERPTVVVIDDLHWAPPEGRELFAALARATAGSRLLLVGCTRPTLPKEWTANLERLEHVRGLSLTRLTADEVREVLTEALASPHLAEQLAPVLTMRSDGNPLFLFEYLRALEDGALDPAAPSASTLRLQGVGVPSTIRQLIQARFASLDDEDQEVLDVAGCLGFEFDPDLVARALGRPVLPVLRRFAQIERNHGLIRSSQRAYVFDHHEVQQALYLGLFAPLREQYHHALARALEERERALDREPDELGGAVAVSLAEHYLRGGGDAQALRYLAAALDHLERTYESAAAVHLAELALGIDRLLQGSARREVLTHQARSLGILGRATEEEAALLQLGRLAESEGDPRARAESKVLLGDLYVRQSRNDEAHSLLEEGLLGARQSADPAVEQFAMVMLTTLFLNTGRKAEALRSCEGALELANRRGDRRAEVTANNHLGIVLGSLGRTEEARLHFLRALTLSREIGYSLGEARALCNVGVAFDVLGRFESACEHHRQYVELSRKLGFRPGEALGEANLGAALSSLGRTSEGLSHLERALVLLREMGAKRAESGALESYGSTLALLGDWVAARTQFERQLALAREVRDPKEEGDALFGLGEISARVGDVASAEEMYAAAIECWTGIEHRDGLASAQLALAALLADAGRSTEALARLSAARVEAEEAEANGALILTSIRSAALSGGTLDEARTLLARHTVGLSFAQRLLASFLLWKTGGAAGDLARAHELLLELREHAPATLRESMMERVPWYREILAAAASR